jgi:hypothetical protein
MRKVNTVSKKGNAVLDLILLSIFLVTLGIVIMTFNPFLNQFNDEFQLEEHANESKAILQEQTEAYSNNWDGMFLMIFILLWIVLLFGAWQLDSHPVFFIITIILMTFAFMVAMTLGNVYEDYMSTDYVMAYAHDFPMMNYLMTHYLQVAIVIGFSVIIVMFAKTRSEGGM